MKIDTSKVRKSFSLFWMIGSLVLILFATRTGDAFALTDALSVDGAAPGLVATLSDEDHQAAVRPLD